MEEHEVAIVEIMEIDKHLKCNIVFPAIYEYCDNANEILETEFLIKKNNQTRKDQYRKQRKFLTSKEMQKFIKNESQ